MFTQRCVRQHELYPLRAEAGTWSTAVLLLVWSTDMPPLCAHYAATAGNDRHGLPCQHKPVHNEAANESMWEVTVEAALGGHDLGSWQVTEDGTGWQVRCRLCDMTAWVGASGVCYSLLADTCPDGGGQAPID